jgi:putative oxidoreductase
MSVAPTWEQEVIVMRYSVLLGRVLFSLLFVMAAFGHFSPQEIAFAAAQGVPFASIVVPLSGIIALVGGLSIALGYKARWGAALIILFLIPVTLTIHNFWSVTDPIAAQDQMAHFMKNVSLIGSAFLIFYFGSGPLSLDTWIGHSATHEERRAA